MKTKPIIKKNLGGRPTEYTPDIVARTREYIEMCEDKDIQTLAGINAKGTKIYKSTLKVNLPTIEGLALHLGISRETIYAWEKDTEKEEFSDIIATLRAKQVKSLIDRGLSGHYNPTIAKVLLAKHGYREQTETDITSKGERIFSSVKELSDEQLEHIATRGSEGTGR